MHQARYGAIDIYTETGPTSQNQAQEIGQNIPQPPTTQNRGVEPSNHTIHNGPRKASAQNWQI